MTIELLPINEALALIFPSRGPSIRYVRERAAELGYAQRIGRRFYMSKEQVALLSAHIQRYGLCRQETASLDPTSYRVSEMVRGTRAARSRSATAVSLPSDESKELQALILRSRRS